MSVDNSQTEYDLHDLRRAVMVLAAELKGRGIAVHDLQANSGRAANSWHAWLKRKRAPKLQTMVAIAAAVGFEIIMRPKAQPETVFILSNVPRAVTAIDAERKRRAMSLGDMEDRSGVSVNSFYAWRGGVRLPQTPLFVALAEALDFDVVMRRPQAAAQPRAMELA